MTIGQERQKPLIEAVVAAKAGSSNEQAIAM